MSQIKNRRKIEKVSYLIDENLFARDGGIIMLPAPKCSKSNKYWIDVELVEDIQPYVTTALLNTISEHWFYAFCYKEIFEDKTVSINIIISEHKSIKMIRNEGGDGDVSFDLDEKHRYARISYMQDGIYLVDDLDGKHIYSGHRMEFRYQMKDGLNWIDPDNTEMIGLELLEQHLRDA